METTSLTFNVEMSRREWLNHQLRVEWMNMLPSKSAYIEFLKQEHNIIVNDWVYFVSDNNIQIMIEFNSEQDYILWKLLQ